MNTPIRNWRHQRVWLLGASSGIGEALARALVAQGAQVALSARRAERLDALAQELPNTLSLPCDAADPQSLALAAEKVLATWGGVDLAVYLAGDYQPMRAWDYDHSVAERLLAVNLLGAMAFAAALTPILLRQGRGQIAFVSSVAGYRGLPKALAYGPSKAALSNFAEALYLDLAPRGLGVRLINPGFVATPLTAKNDFAMPALISPEQAAEEILRGLAGSGFEIHFPKRFTRWLKLLRLLPYRLYFPLVRRFTGA
ncbi:putative oxidoreductase [Burkholderiales bacterium]|nr:MAG: SDR family NAD(P)-dependent oxidoreductase [Burkholderiales bacterium]CAG0952573.1 putative oxidoreductase [Burkholderiales bacterium]